MELKINVEKREKGIYTVFLDGPLDAATYRSLDESIAALLKESPAALILHMEGVPFVGSMGVGVILKAKQALERGGGCLILTNVSPQAKKVFDLVALLPDLNVFAGLSEVEAYIEKNRKP